MKPRDSATILIAMFATGIAVAKPVPPATPAGKPVDCVNLQDIRETRVRDDQTIDFYLSGRKTYRNTLPYKCSGLGFQQAFSYKTSINRLCSVDLITVIQQGAGPMRGATCGLGKFQPVTGLPR
jgi:hypothetical protein